MLGSWVETDDILVGKLMPQGVKESSFVSAHVNLPLTIQPFESHF